MGIPAHSLFGGILRMSKFDPVKFVDHSDDAHGCASVARELDVSERPTLLIRYYNRARRLQDSCFAINPRLPLCIELLRNPDMFFSKQAYDSDYRLSFFALLPMLTVISPAKTLDF